MKKILTLAAATAALTATAVVPARQLPANDRHDAPVKRSEAPAPRGDVRFYDVTAFSQYEAWGDIYAGDLTCVKSLVFAEDGTVWFENLSNGFQGEYTRGTIDGDRITVDFPQVYTVWTYEDWETGEEITEEYRLFAMDAEEMEEDGLRYYAFTMSDVQSIEFSYDAESGEIRQIGDKAIAICIATPDGYEYYGCADLGYVMTPNTTIQAVTEPEGIEYRDALFTYTDAWEFEPLKRFVRLAKTDDAIYVRGINQFLPDAVVRLDRKGDGYVLPTGEYLGQSWGDNIYTLIARFAEDMEQYDILDEMEFNYDEETGTLTYADYRDALLLNNSLDEVSYLDGFFFPVFTPYDIPASAVPAPATDLSFYDGNWEINGTCEISFAVDPVSTDGVALPDNRLYYELYVDDEPFTFMPEDYSDLEEEMTMVPLMFTDHWDISYSGNVHYITFFSVGMDSIGVRLHYRNDDGTFTPGEMTRLVFDDSGVDLPAADGHADCHDLTGRRVANPGKGIHIVRDAKGVRKVMTK